MAGKTVVERLIIEIGGDASKFKKELKAIQKDERGFEGSLKSMAVVGKASFLAVGSAAVALGTIATKAFASFETGITNVAKTTNLAGKNLEDFKDEIMAMSERIPVSTDKLLEIATAAGQLGIKGGPQISKFTEVIAKLGATTNVEGEEAALTIARLLNLTGESVDNVDKLGAALVDLGNNFATSEAEILEVSKDVGKAVVNFGLASDEVLGISAAMASLGIQAEAGGTVIGKAFMAIDQAIRSQGGPAFEKLVELTGMTGDALTETFQTDATAVFQSFIQGLGKAGAEGKDLTAELGAMELSGIRVNKILPTLANRSDILSDALKRAGIASQDASALNEEAAKAFETNSAKWQLAQNKINNTMIKLGAEIAPDVTMAFESIADSISENKEAITLIGKAIAGTIRILSTALGTIGKLISSLGALRKKELADIQETYKAEIESANEVIKLYEDREKASKKSTSKIVSYLKDVWNMNKNLFKQIEDKKKADKEYVDSWVKTSKKIVDTQKKTDKKLKTEQGKAADAKIKAIEATNEKAYEAELDAADAEFARLQEENNAKLVEQKLADRKRLDQQRAANDEKLEKFIDELEEEQFEQREANKNKLTEEQKHYAQLADLREQNADDAYDANENQLLENDNLYAKYHKGVLLSETAFGQQMVRLKELQGTAEYGATKTAAGELAGLINSKNNELKSIGKAASIVQIGISTAESAMKAFNGLAWIPYVGIPLGAIAAGAVAAYGVEKINEVRGMQTGGIVGGTGRGDKVPTLLEPGELVVPRDLTAEILREYGARKMASGGKVAGASQSKDQWKTFNDIFGVPGIFKAILGLSGGDSDTTASGFGAQDMTDVPAAMMGALEEAADKLLYLLLNSIPVFGKILYDLIKTAKMPLEELKNILGESGLSEVIDGLDISDNLISSITDLVGNVLEQAGGFVGGIGGLLGFQNGGIVPGSGSGDIVPALLEPGELVIPKSLTTALLSPNVDSPTGGGGGTQMIGVEIMLNQNAAEVINAQIREGSNLGTIKPAT